jgi:hypothetical protein
LPFLLYARCPFWLRYGFRIFALWFPFWMKCALRIFALSYSLVKGWLNPRV